MVQLLPHEDSLDVHTIVVSDVHIGSPVSGARALKHVLESLNYKKLVINGDILDTLDFGSLDKHDWDLWHYLQDMTNPQHAKEIVWIRGNHDHLITRLWQETHHIDVLNEHEWSVGGNNFLAMHGDQFDDFWQRHMKLSFLIGDIYIYLQRFDTKDHRISEWVKKASNRWRKSAQRISSRFGEYVKGKNIHYALHGHTHIAGIEVAEHCTVINSGTWAARRCHYIAIDDKGTVSLREFDSKDFRVSTKRTIREE